MSMRGESKLTDKICSGMSRVLRDNAFKNRSENSLPICNTFRKDLYLDITV